MIELSSFPRFFGSLSDQSSDFNLFHLNFSPLHLLHLRSLDLAFFSSNLLCASHGKFDIAPIRPTTFPFSASLRGYPGAKMASIAEPRETPSSRKADHSSSRDAHHDLNDHEAPDAQQTPTPRPPQSTDLGFEAVTPGIDPRAYLAKSETRRGDGPNSSYFSRADTVISPDSQARNSLVRQATSRTTMERRESLSDIRAANPDLHLSGNIISATFNAPHAFTYRKGGQWVGPAAQIRHTDVN